MLETCSTDNVFPATICNYSMSYQNKFEQVVLFTAHIYMALCTLRRYLIDSFLFFNPKFYKMVHTCEC